MVRLGFIGTGNMGGALAVAAARRAGTDIFCYDRSRERAEALKARIQNISPDCNCAVCDCYEAVTENSDFLFIGVKPQGLKELAGSIRDILNPEGSLKQNDSLNPTKSIESDVQDTANSGNANSGDANSNTANSNTANSGNANSNTVIVSMLAGTSIEQLQSELGGSFPVIRIMPNINVSVGEGAVLYTCNELVGESRLAEFLDIMEHAGEFVELSENLFSAGSAISGCGPAFAALFVEALADGGVACGLPRDVAERLAAAMCAGTGKNIANVKDPISPAELKNRVCSPGGTTIQGVRALEAGGFRTAVMEAVIAAYERDRSL